MSGASLRLRHRHSMSSSSSNGHQLPLVMEEYMKYMKRIIYTIIKSGNVNESSVSIEPHKRGFLTRTTWLSLKKYCTLKKITSSRVYCKQQLNKCTVKYYKSYILHSTKSHSPIYLLICICEIYSQLFYCVVCSSHIVINMI